eukprot:scaffold1135_cov343-Prasinococcus_capsulatus_cf.AAC.4
MRSKALWCWPSPAISSERRNPCLNRRSRSSHSARALPSPSFPRQADAACRAPVVHAPECVTLVACRAVATLQVDVNGPNTHPVYKYLKGSYAEKHAKPMEDITWNFAKFLISRDGYVVDKYTPHTQPMEMVAAIEALL